VRNVLGGWTRVWIVTSVLWCLTICVRELAHYPSEGYYLDQAHAFIREVPNADAAFRASMLELAALNSKPEQLANARAGWWYTVAFEALVPSFLLALAFLVIGWVRRGFTSRRPGVRIVEAEIEEP